MASSGLAATSLTASQTALQQRKQQQTMPTPSNSSSPAPSNRSAAPVTTVAIHNGKTIGINDHIYISAAWAPGAGEPYMIARVMEFVTAASSRSGAAALASSSGTLQVRANVFLRMRDISLRNTNDPRLLVATMHSDVFSLDNIRGICNVRHRDLIGSGSAPDVSQWKKKEDHFYYHQFYDRYIHRFYDVIPTEKVKNAPPEVLTALKTRYSFVVAEPGMMADLCDALRGCAVCHRWAASVESVRCDTCKKFFHMKCLNPPLASKPAKGYSWTCAPCSKRHEQDVGNVLSTGGTLAPNGQGLVRAAVTASARGGRGATLTARRGRGRGGALSARRALMGQEEAGFSDHSPDGSPAPEKTIDDIRGTRCFGRWPFRYFGQHTHALDVLDPHDSVYPIATTRLGVKYQAVLPSWQEQQAAGLGVHFRAKGSAKDEDGGGNAEDGGAEAVGSKPIVVKRKGGRPPKRKRGGGGGGMAEQPDRLDSPMTAFNSPTALPAAMPSEPPEFERGSDHSVTPIFRPSIVAEERVLDAYIKAARQASKNVAGFNVDLLIRALMLLTEKGGNMVAALQALSQSKPEDLRIVPWSAKELKHFETAMRECNADMRQLKKRIPTKKYSDIVRQFVVWKTQRLRQELEAQAQERAGSGDDGDADASGETQKASSLRTAQPSMSSVSRAVSPSLSVFGDDSPPSQQQHQQQQQQQQTTGTPPSRSCSMCSTTTSEVWYKGPTSWPNRALCVNCGLYWRKYAAEAHNTELISVNTRNKLINAATTAAAVTSTAAEENGVLGVAPFHKLGKGKNASVGAGKAGAAGTTSANGTVGAVGAATAPYGQRVDPLPCVICRQIEPRQKLAQCHSCTLSVHQACFGLNAADMEAAAAEGWFCEACENEQTLDAALVPRCILCSKQAQDDAYALCVKRGEEAAAAATAAAGPKAVVPEKPRGRGRPSLESQRARQAALLAAAAAASRPAVPPLGPLDAFKPTECNNWVHLLCALFTPEVVFSDPARLKTVEGCGNLPTWRYESICSLCKQQTGSCVTCAETGCRRTFHVSCAVNREEDFVVGLEVGVPLGKGKKVGVESVTFQGETGVMGAVVYCREHRQGTAGGGGSTTTTTSTGAGGKAGAASSASKGGRMFDLADVDRPLASASDGDGSVPSAPASDAQTALQLYARTYKHVGAVVSGQGSSNAASSAVAHMTDSSYALMRRAKRFDLLSHSSSSSLSSAAVAAGGKGGTWGITATPAPSASTGEMKLGLHIGSSAALGYGLADEEDEEEGAEECCRCHAKASPFWWTVREPRAEEEPTEEEESGIKAEHTIHRFEAEGVDAGKNRVCCTFCRPAFFPALGTEQRQGARGGEAEAR